MIRPRRLTALFAVCALAFAQVAVAAHACAKLERAASVAATEAHPACHGSQAPHEVPPGDNVCEKHCQYGDASLDGAQSPPAAVDRAGPILRMALADAIASAGPRAAWRYVPAAAPPPPAILFGVLRI